MPLIPTTMLRPILGTSLIPAEGLRTSMVQLDERQEAVPSTTMKLLGRLRVALIVPIPAAYEADAFVTITTTMRLPGEARAIVLTTSKLVTSLTCSLVVGTSIPSTSEATTAT